MAAYEATKASGFYEKNPGREQPIMQMIGKPPTENSRGIRAVNLPQLRDIQNEEFEAMLAGEQSAQQALDNAVARGNEAISQALGRPRRRAMRPVRHRARGPPRQLPPPPGRRSHLRGVAKRRCRLPRRGGCRGRNPRDCRRPGCGNAQGKSARLRHQRAQQAPGNNIIAAFTRRAARACVQAC